MAALTTRGLKSAVPYTYASFLHNFGGDYLDKNRRPALCSKEAQAATAFYAGLLRDFGPPGVINYTYYQDSSVYREGRVVMEYEATNELGPAMEGGARLKDTTIALLPAGVRNQPTLLSWGLAVSAFSKRPETAWYFVQWATAPAMQSRLALEGIAPPRSSAGNDPKFKQWIDAEPVRRQWMDAIQRAAKIGSTEIGVPIVANPASRDIIGGMVDDVMLGQKTVAQACAEANKAISDLIAKE
jgi:multiple sugar transport system substrate-binding protein